MSPENYLSMVAGTVTVYNSDRSIVANIGTYIHQLGRLYVIDNSDRRDEGLSAAICQLSPTIEYIRNDQNAGLGVALNKAARRAIEDKFTYLLMMDDDSSMSAGAVEQLYGTATSDFVPKIGIVSARQIDSSSRTNSGRPTATKVTIEQTAITAGSLLNLMTYQHVGPFQEDLFVDWVDIEYSFRLKRFGYHILQDHIPVINHRIGLKKQVKLLGVFPYKWRSHSPLRLYYKFRNSLFIMQREGDNIPTDFRRRFRKELRRNIVRILLAEPNKMEFYRMIKKAIRDARNGQLGKLI